MASLDHAMWFHRPFRADEWLLYDQDTPSASGGRGLGRGLIFTAATAHLARPVVQEGLIRASRDADDGDAARRAVAGASLVAAASCTRRRRRPRRPTTAADHGRAATTPTGADGRPAGDADARRRSTLDARGGRRRSTSRSRWPPGPATPTCYVAEQGGRGPPHRGRATTSSTTTTVTYEVADHAGARHLRRGHRPRASGACSASAFSPDGRTLYVDYTERRRRHRTSSSTRSATDDDRRRHPPRAARRRRSRSPNHNGGQLVVRPRRLPLHRPGRRRQRRRPAAATARTPTTLLGKILRIDPERRRGGPAVRHPRRQPVRRRRRRRARDLALRPAQPVAVHVRPRRPATSGSADVGQDEFEEIDCLPAAAASTPGQGANLGWNEIEGDAPLRGRREPGRGVLPDLRVRPRRRGCSVTGGYVYRGDAIPGARRARTSSPTTARHRRPRPAGRRRHGGRHAHLGLPVDDAVLVRPGRRRRAVRAVASGAVLKLVAP